MINGLKNNFLYNKMEEIVYPILENKETKWTEEYRREYNRNYRNKVKSGEIVPTKRVQDSKWQNRDYKIQYNKVRYAKLCEEIREKKLSLEPVVSTYNGKRPNYTNKEKEEILKKMLELLKQGKDFDHPYLTFSLKYKPEEKRDYNKHS